MWVFEEMVNGRKLTEIINETHCNEKYLPDFELGVRRICGHNIRNNRAKHA